MELAAAWCAHLVGLTMVSTVLAGLSGFRREWVAAAGGAWQAFSRDAFALANLAASQQILKASWRCGPLMLSHDACRARQSRKNLPA
jgi:hypothetical protein